MKLCLKYRYEIIAKRINPPIPPTIAKTLACLLKKKSTTTGLSVFLSFGTLTLGFSVVLMVLVTKLDCPVLFCKCSVIVVVFSCSVSGLEEFSVPTVYLIERVFKGMCTAEVFSVADVVPLSFHCTDDTDDGVLFIVEFDTDVLIIESSAQLPSNVPRQFYKETKVY